MPRRTPGEPDSYGSRDASDLPSAPLTAARPAPGSAPESDGSSFSARRGRDTLAARGAASPPALPSVSVSQLRDAARRASDHPAGGDSLASRAAGGRSSGRRAAPHSSSSPASQFLPPPTRTPPRSLAYEIAGVLCLAVGALLMLNALRPAEGFLPQIGVGAMRWLFGIGAVVVPGLLCLLGVLLIARRQHLNLRAFGRGAAVAFLVLLTAVHLAVPRGHEFDGHKILFAHGGYAGGTLAWTLRTALGEVGAVIALLALSLVSVLFWSEVSLAQVAARLGDFVHRSASRLRMQRAQRPAGFNLSAARPDDVHEPPHQGAPEFRAEARRAAPHTRLLPRQIIQDARGSGSPGSALPLNHPADGAAQRTGEGRGNERALEPAGQSGARNGAAPRSPFLSVDELLAEAGGEPRLAAGAPRIEFTDAPPPQPVVVTTPVAAKADDELTPVEALEAQALATAGGGAASDTARKQRPAKIRRRFGDGPLMPEYFDDAVRALDPPVVADVSGVEDDIHAGVRAVQDTLASFKIDARVTDVKRGPVITRYEVQPAPGVRVAAIAGLDRDMARALSAIAVRIEAPVPGKDVIGIEVPNKRVHLVRLRDVLERHDFLAAPSKLAFVLGKDIAGQPKWADLTKMPHLLIAGATNSGKSVCLNSIIASILVRADPSEVKFSLIDPKRVELTLFKDIRHLYHPVVVEPKDAVRALRGSIAEMDRRYKRFAERGVRNIASYNAKLEEGEAPLPYLVIVIDELADLMMTAAAEFEKLICRLAQLARATGIHLIVATQRPSVNVITGVIKANIPSRIAFAVASQVDSRTILDAVGAERLIGSGDMLFDANNGGKAVRIQGAYLSEEEVNRVVTVVKEHYAEDEMPFEYAMNLDEIEEAGGFDDEGGRDEEKRDELYSEILEFVQRNTEMSASLIQRKFEIGYPRAGRIVDQLERDGVLSPADGSKPRKVIGNGR